MINGIIHFSLHNRLFIILGALVLLGAGIFSARHLPVDAVPDITNVQVQINTVVPALAPEETEKLVTYPMEQALMGTLGLKEFRSLTKSRLSQITLVFEDGTDVFRARQLVSERLEQVELAHDLVPKLSPLSTGLGEIVYYTLDFTSDAPERKHTRHEQLMELRDVNDYVVKPFLRQVSGVAEVNSSGGYERQLVILPKPEALRAAGMTIAELAGVIGQNVNNTGGGVIESGTDRVLIRGVSKATGIEDLANLPVKFAAAAEPLKVKDLAEVGIGNEVRTGCAVENGHEAVMGTVMMLVGENSRVVSLRVEKKLAELQEKLPKGMKLRIQYTRSEVVNHTIDTVKKNLFEGAVLVVALLLLLLGNWRAALIVATAIPLAFLFALIGMTFGGVSGNLMSLGAVDFGLIIDGAVVMVENATRVLTERQIALGRPLNAQERMEAVRDAAKQVGSPMFFGVLIITLVYVPILALTGIEGKMFHPMAITVMLALGGALVLALTLMPTLCSLLLRGGHKEGDNALMRLAKWIYAPLLHFTWEWRWIVVAAVMALMAVTAGIAMTLKQEFVPTLNEGSWTVMVYQSSKTNLSTSLDRCCRTQRYLLEHVPEITRAFARLGTSEVATDPMSPGEYDLYLFYKPEKDWRKEDGKPVSRDRLAAIIRQELNKEVPEQAYYFAQPIQMRFNEMLEGSRAELAVKIFGEDYDVMEGIGEKVKGVLESMSGTASAEFETQGRVPALEIRVNRASLLKFNVEAAQVNAAIATAMAGNTVGTLIEHERLRDIVVRLPENLRNQPEVLKTMPVRTQDGGLVSLGQLAEFVAVKQVDAIGREFGRRRVGINVDLVSDVDVERFVAEVRRKIDGIIEFPPGYRVDFSGQFERMAEARERLMLVVPAALVMIFMLIHATFRSVGQTMIVYSGIPFAITGGLLALWVRQLPFSISAAVGFIALSGVAVLNGVVLISCFNQMRSEGLSCAEAVRQGSLQRLRPVLMTALVASLGFVPMALSQGLGAEVQRPLATVVIGGILSSTFLTLILLPLFYRWLGEMTASASDLNPEFGTASVSVPTASLASMSGGHSAHQA